jgi:hypothetical protein
MSKPICIVSCPIDTFSGYGARSRDFVKSLIASKGEEWDIKILSQRWGQTPFGALNEDIPEEKDLKDRIAGALTMNLSKQPEIWIQITVPNEFQPVGKFNIGVTAGIETTLCDASWIEGCNRMNLILTSSDHSKKVFNSSKFEQRNQTGQAVGVLELKTPIEVLFEGADFDIIREHGREKIIQEAINYWCDAIHFNDCSTTIDFWVKHREMIYAYFFPIMLLKVCWQGLVLLFFSNNHKKCLCIFC